MIPIDYDNFCRLNGNIKWQVPILLLSFCMSSLILAEDRRVTTKDGKAKDPQIGIKIPSELTVPAEWQSLLNPSTDEFWTEGNFKPDAGFILWAKNPTINNAKLYLIRMNAKRDRIHVMQGQQEQANKELIKLGVIANDYNFLASATRTDPKGVLASVDNTQIFFIFNPTCPHCKRQAQILAHRSNVIPMQIGGSELINFPDLPPSVWATKEDIDRYAADKVVPVLLIYDQKSNQIVSAKGVHTLQEIENIAIHLKKGGSKGGK